MGKTYKAVEITKPGTFRLVEKPVVGPGEEQVRIRVEACGVCHSDAGTVEGQLPGVVYPRVPGHEAIGRIEEVGRRVTTWKVGQRVGVGFFGGEDGTCETCRRGDTAYCQNPIITGVTSDGGYAEMMIAIPLLSRVSAVWGISACNTPKRWASAPLRSASVQTKNISRPSWERTFTSTPRPRMREQHCRSWEVPTSSWRPPPAEPQSPACFLASPFAAGSLWLASQAIQFRSTEFR
jgi:alcohol dehydrogenase-like protein